jgi:hypothetical protein
MATEPRTIRESNILVGGIEARLGLLQKLLWVVLALLAGLLSGAAALYVQIGDVKTDLAVLKTNLSAVAERVNKIDKSVETISADLNRAVVAVGRIEARLSAASPMPLQQQPQQPQQQSPPQQRPRDILLSESEMNAIREILKPATTGTLAASMRLGDRMSETLPPLPAALVDKIPKLKDFRYTVDRNSRDHLAELKRRLMSRSETTKSAMAASRAKPVPDSAHSDTSRALNQPNSPAAAAA